MESKAIFSICVHVDFAAQPIIKYILNILNSHLWQLADLIFSECRNVIVSSCHVANVTKSEAAN